MWLDPLLCYSARLLSYLSPRVTFFLQGSSQEIPSPECVCVFYQEFASDLLSPDCVRVSKKKCCQQEVGRGGGLQGAGAGTKQQRLPVVYQSVFLTMPLTSFCYENESECVREPPVAGLHTGRGIRARARVCVCVCSLSVTMRLPRPCSSRRLRLVHGPPNRRKQSGSRADASALSWARTKNKQEVDGEGAGPAINTAVIATTNALKADGQLPKNFLSTLLQNLRLNLKCDNKYTCFQWKLEIITRIKSTEAYQLAIAQRVL